MNIIDQDIHLSKPGQPLKQDSILNPLKLAAACLFIFGHHFLFYSYKGMDYGDSDLYNDLPIVIGLLAGGLIAIIPGQSKLISVLGIGIILFASYFPYINNTLNGWPTRFLFYTGYAMALGALLTRVAYNSVYMSPTQRIILVFATAASYIASFLGSTIEEMHIYNEKGFMLIAVVMLISTVICILVDSEPETKKGDFQSFFGSNPSFLLKCILPLLLGGVILFWLDMQCDVYYGRHELYEGNNQRLLITFFMFAAFIGLIALMMKQINQLNPFLVLGIAGVIKLVIFLICLTKPVNGDFDWAIATINWFTNALIWFGLELLIYKNASFPGLAVLFAGTSIAYYVADILADYVHIEAALPFTYTNF